MIITCKCGGPGRREVVAFQESIYGPNKRIANRVNSDNANPMFRCTVCSQTSGAR